MSVTPFAHQQALVIQVHPQPWLLSNITDTETGRVPGGLKEFVILEKAGLRIGIIGLVEKFVDTTFMAFKMKIIKGICSSILEIGYPPCLHGHKTLCTRIWQRPVFSFPKIFATRKANIVAT